MLGIDVHKIESIVITAVVLALGVRLFFFTLHGIETEVKATQYLSVIAAQNGANLRQITEREKVDLPVTQGKVNDVLDNAKTALDTTNTTMKSVNTLVKHLDKDRDKISPEVVNSLKQVTADLKVTAISIKEVGDQAVATGDSIAQAAGDTAKATTDTAKAVTGTAQATTKLVTDVHDPVAQSSKNLQNATGDLSEMTKEGKTWVHSVLHPKWPAKIFGAIRDYSAKVLGAWL